MAPKGSSPSVSSASLLRRITIFTFIPAFPLLLSHGIVSHKPFPALGLLPLAGSVVLGCFILYRDRIAVSGSSTQKLSVFFADVLLAIMLLAFLIVTWVTLTLKDWGCERSQIILATYGTVFMVVNCVIHLYFAGLHLLHKMATRSCNCAHCQSVTKSGRLMRMVSEYTLLSEDDPEEEEDLYTDVEAGKDQIPSDSSH
ncbi:hypothetical protein SLS58_001182 [Diplodia intermedia]|uniref:Uncharacterized protein n=1 Tax=Diplodia intermedia TaxID=856260 RepID=A0ABR3U3G1_9PEZI